MSNPWTDAEIATLRELWPTRSAREIGIEMNCSKGSVSGMALRLGLTREAGAIRHILQRAGQRGGLAAAGKPRNRRNTVISFRPPPLASAVKVNVDPTSPEARAAEAVLRNAHDAEARRRGFLESLSIRKRS